VAAPTRSRSASASCADRNHVGTIRRLPASAIPKLNNRPVARRFRQFSGHTGANMGGCRPGRSPPAPTRPGTRGSVRCAALLGMVVGSGASGLHPTIPPQATDSPLPVGRPGRYWSHRPGRSPQHTERAGRGRSMMISGRIAGPRSRGYFKAGRAPRNEPLLPRVLERLCEADHTSRWSRAATASVAQDQNAQD